jgi:hypothetical protein
MGNSDVYPIISVFSILVGISIVAFWVRLYFRKQLYEPESLRSEIETKYHLAAELLTAIVLTIGAIGLIGSMSWAVGAEFLGLGMLLYANVNGPGFYAAKGDRSMVRVFYVTAALAALVIIVLLVVSS